MMFRENHSTIGGKVSIFTAILAVLILVIGVMGELPHGKVARASTATTSVTVLNTPPQWDTNVYIQESIAGATSSSATSTSPTNAGSTVTWYASSTDSSNDNYYALICNNYASPTPVNGGPPTCNGGNVGRLIAISGATQSGTAASLSTTTFNGDPTEVFTYYGYICDGNAGGAACNPLAYSPTTNPNTTVATTSPNASPFIVNHRPSFSLFVNNSPVNPGGTVSWFATATDQDTYSGRATDTLKLFICKVADFTGTACGPGGTWATSTYVTLTPTSTLVLTTPYAKGSYNAFGYVIDYHGIFAASGGQQGVNSAYTVNNVTPSIAAASISLFSSTGTSPLILTNLATQTQNFSVQFTVTDQNSCMTQAAGAEITNSIINVYRSSVASTSCNTAAQYNANRCYPAAVGTPVWNYSCIAGACAGTSSVDMYIPSILPLRCDRSWLSVPGGQLACSCL